MGLVTTALLAPRWELSRSRARLISIAGVAGLLAGFGMDLIAQVDSEKTAFFIPMVTSAAGLAAGIAWTRSYDERRRDAENGTDALLDWHGGRLTLGTPLPQPAWLETARNGARAPGVRISLLHAQF